MRLRTVSVTAAVMTLTLLAQGPARSDSYSYDTGLPIPADQGVAACSQSARDVAPNYLPLTAANQRFKITLSNLPLGISPGQFIDAVTQSANAWNDAYNDCGVGDVSHFEFVSVGTQIAAPTSGNFVNEIGFAAGDPPDCPASLDCLGIKYPQYPAGSGHEWDVILNGDHSWTTSGLPVTAYDLANTLTHEFGHVAGLYHPQDPDNDCIKASNVVYRQLTMYACSSPNETMKRTLGLGELLYVQELFNT